MNKDNNFKLLHNPALLKALENRQAYFDSLSPEKKEEAFKFQEVIDAELQKAGNPLNRMSVIQRLMREQLLELHKHTSELSLNLKNLDQNIKALKPENLNP